MHLSIFCPPGGGGGHTRGFRQKTIPDRREFDKLMESGSRVIQTLAGFTSRDLMHQAGSRVGIQTKIVVSRVGIQTPNILRCQIPLGQPAAPPDGQNIDRCISEYCFKGMTFLIDYEGYTFVFFIKKNKQVFFIKM